MKNIVTFILIISYLNLAGCISTEVVNSENLKYDQSKALRIEMKDGTNIRFAAGNYKVIEKSDTMAIIGKGSKFVKQQVSVEIPFEGTLYSTDIKTITAVEPTLLVYSIPLYIGIVTVIGLIILISFGGRSVGG